MGRQMQCLCRRIVHLWVHKQLCNEKSALLSMKLNIGLALAQPSMLAANTLGGWEQLWRRGMNTLEKQREAAMIGFAAHAHIHH